MFPEWLKRDGGFPVKITGYNGTTHAHDWTLQIIEPDGSMTADTRTISGGSLFELNDQQVATDSYIFARWAGLDESGMSVFMCAKGGGDAFFPVLVVWSAGSDGDATNYATWTYNVYALADTGHATALTAAAVQPENSPARIVKGPVTKATTDSIGQAYYAADGTVHLYTCAEKHGSCT
jgi:hypothetical protein